MIAVSVCIIVKNEELNISECLKRLAKQPFELIVVDTGSTDRTKELARLYTDKVFDFPWCDDFSAARNFSISKASHDWILVVDCDEFLEEIDLEGTYTLMSEYPDAIGQITRHSLCHTSTGETVMTDSVERLFRRTLYKYEGSIHEQLVPLSNSLADTVATNKDTTSVLSTNVTTPITLTVFKAPLSFIHTGYNGTADAINQKAQRNIDLLLKELSQNPSDPYLYYQLGESYNLKGDYENAFQYFDRGFYLDVDETLPYVKMMITSYGYSMIETGRFEKALGLEGVYDTFKDYADFVCMMGDLYLKLQMNQQALDQFLYALSLSDYSVEGANSYIPLHNIGCIYDAYGYKDAAKEAFEKAASYGYAPSIERMQNI